MARRPSRVVVEAKPSEPSEVLELRAARPALAPRRIARWGVYAAALVVVGAVVGWLVADLGTPVHGARAEVLYELSGDQSTGFLREDRQLTTQLVALRSRAVLEPVAQENGLTFEELVDKVHVSVVEGSEVVRVDVHDESADRARSLAAGVTFVYLSQHGGDRMAEARRFLRKEMKNLDERRAELKDRMILLQTARVQELGPDSQPGAEEAALAVEIEGLIQQSTEVLSRLEDVAVDDFAGPRVEQITEAYVLDEPVSPRPVRAAATGAIGGALVAAAVIAYLVRRRATS
jgi:capsular polysaccharide biosynthesis protein